MERALLPTRFEPRRQIGHAGCLGSAMGQIASEDRVACDVTLVKGFLVLARETWDVAMQKPGCSVNHAASPLIGAGKNSLWV